MSKKRGVYKGRPTFYSPTSADLQKRVVYDRVINMLKTGDLITEIAKTNGIPRQTVYRIKDATAPIEKGI